MSTAVTIDLSVDPAKVDEFLAFIKDIAPDTRAYDGCQMFDICKDQDVWICDQCGFQILQHFVVDFSLTEEQVTNALC